MLTTRVVPTRGSILIGGVDLVAKPALAKQLIGVVPQSNTLDRAMTVFENLEFHGRYFGMSAKQARGLASYDSHTVAELVGLLHVVGGQQDRLAVVVEVAEGLPQCRCGSADRGRRSARRGTAPAGGG